MKNIVLTCCMAAAIAGCGGSGSAYIEFGEPEVREYPVQSSFTKIFTRAATYTVSGRDAQGNTQTAILEIVPGPAKSLPNSPAPSPIPTVTVVTSVYANGVLIAANTRELYFSADYFRLWGLNGAGFQSVLPAPGYARVYPSASFGPLSTGFLNIAGAGNDVEPTEFSWQLEQATEKTAWLCINHLPGGRSLPAESDCIRINENGNATGGFRLRLRSASFAVELG